MIFTKEDFESCAYGAHDVDREDAQHCADIANTKTALIQKQLQIARDALRVCAQAGSPSANEYFARYPK